jgi:hypothetical protein
MWMAKVCGIDQDIVNAGKVKSHLESVYKYNFKKELSDQANQHRSTYALGHEGGLLLCTWPRGNALSLPFVYNCEIWTGIEYQVASHLMFFGRIDEALQIVKTARKRYDGKKRNPFDEFECGHWYARAMSSYSMIQGLTGVQYDAVTKTLYIDSKIGNDFDSFFSSQSGWGNVGLERGKPYIKMVTGSLDVKRCIISGTDFPVSKIKYD